ncbi:hypothetical protein EVAR_100888_1, partial [Eumeta japonica]
NWTASGIVTQNRKEIENGPGTQPNVGARLGLEIVTGSKSRTIPELESRTGTQLRVIAKLSYNMWEHIYVHTGRPGLESYMELSGRGAVLDSIVFKPESTCFDADRLLSQTKPPALDFEYMLRHRPRTVNASNLQSNSNTQLRQTSSDTSPENWRILLFFTPQSGCPISGYADGGLEVHSVPLLRQPQPATFLLTYLPALPTAEVYERPRTNIGGSDPSSIFEIRHLP